MKKLSLLLHWDELYLLLIAILLFLWALTFNLGWIIFIVYIIYFYKRMHLFTLFLCIIVCFFVWHLTINQKHLTEVHGMCQVVDVKELTYSKQYVVLYQRKKYHITMSSKTLYIGDHVYVKALIEPYYKQTIPKGFDAYTFYLSQGIYGKLNIEEIEFIKHKDTVNKLRYTLLERLKMHSHNAYVFALFFGENTYDVDTKNEFKASGIYFLLSVSGMHMFVLFFYIRKIFFYLDIQQKTQNKFLLCIYLIFIYLHQYSFTMLRLSIYAGLVFISQKLHLKLDRLECLFITFIVCCLLNMHLIYSQSFWALLLILTMLKLKMTHINHYFGYKKAIIQTAYISLLTVPFFSQLNILNFFLMPIFIFLMTYLAIPLSIFGLFFKELESIFIFLIQFITHHMPLILAETKIFHLPKLSRTLLTGYSFFYFYTIRKRSLKQIFILCLGLSICLFIPVKITQEQSLQVIFLDVGQGDSTLILYDQCVIVIDAFMYVGQYLSNHGYQHIDYLVLTHAHLDHIKEASDLIEKFNVKNIVINPYDIYHLNHNQMLTMDHKSHFSCGKYTHQVLAPLKNYNSPNNNSLVIQSHLDELVFLFTGDIEIEAENDLAAYYKNHLKSDVLKIGHHGSRTSSSALFLSYVYPKIGIISTKKANRYGFPHQETLNRLYEMNILIYQTSEVGTIIYRRKNKLSKWLFHLPI